MGIAALNPSYELIIKLGKGPTNFISKQFLCTTFNECPMSRNNGIKIQSQQPFKITFKRFTLWSDAPQPWPANIQANFKA